MRESRLRDSKMRDAYFELRRSTNDISRVDIPGEGHVNGIKLRASTAFDGPDGREVTLLESGMILEHVDVRRQEREERDWRQREEHRTRKASRVSIGEASSMHSTSNPIMPVNFASRSQISLTTSATSPGAMSMRRMSTPMALSPSGGGRPGITRGTSQNSVETKSTPRFFGFRHWRGAHGSEASLHHNSGSMLDMQ